MEWKHPFTCMVTGPTGSGKSYFVKTFLEHYRNLFKNIIWCYSEWQPLYDALSCCNFKEGLPQGDDFSVEDGPNLVIIDDLMRECNNQIVDIFTRGSHHRNLSVIFITQNIFHQHKGMRDISLNCHYIVCFKNPRDQAQINYLARQLYPGNAKFIQEAYQDATHNAHGYLLFDLKQDTPDEQRVRTNIFPVDSFNYVYVPIK